MAKKSSRARAQGQQLREGMANAYIETLREFAPRSTERLISAGIQLLEAHREFLGERIARLEQAKASIAQSPSRASRTVRVRGSRKSTRKAT